MSDLAALDLDEPIPLDTACSIYPRARLTVSTLRREADRGRLDIFKLGRRQYTTARAMAEMVRKCQDADRRPDSTSTRPETNGLSETDYLTSARAALDQSVRALKSGLPRISPQSTRRSAGQSH
jgi:hypothetical protein